MDVVWVVDVARTVVWRFHEDGVVLVACQYAAGYIDDPVEGAIDIEINVLCGMLAVCCLKQLSRVPSRSCA